MLEKCNFESTISYGEYNFFDIYDPFLTSMPSQLFEGIFQKKFFHVIQYPRNSPQKNFHRKIPWKNHIKYAPLMFSIDTTDNIDSIKQNDDEVEFSFYTMVYRWVLYRSDKGFPLLHSF